MQGRSRVGARAAALRRGREPAPWWMWAALAGGLLMAAPAWAQAPTVPEKVEPRAIPPGAGGDQAPKAPGGDTLRTTPDSGVVTPPPMGATGAVIRPPATGTMPVIPPPGSPGGDRTVVPK